VFAPAGSAALGGAEDGEKGRSMIEKFIVDALLVVAAACAATAVLLEIRWTRRG